jgi:hypothetical protein
LSENLIAASFRVVSIRVHAGPCSRREIEPLFVLLLKYSRANGTLAFDVAILARVTLRAQTVKS